MLHRIEGFGPRVFSYREEEENNIIEHEIKREKMDFCLGGSIMRETTRLRFSLQRFCKAYKSRRIYDALTHFVK